MNNIKNVENQLKLKLKYHCFPVIPTHTMNIGGKIMEIPPLSEEISRHEKEKLTDNGRTTENITPPPLVVGGGIKIDIEMADTIRFDIEPIYRQLTIYRGVTATDCTDRKSVV